MALCGFDGDPRPTSLSDDFSSWRFDLGSSGSLSLKESASIFAGIGASLGWWSESALCPGSDKV